LFYQHYSRYISYISSNTSFLVNKYTEMVIVDFKALGRLLEKKAMTVI